MNRADILAELKTILRPYTADKEMLNNINDDTDLIKDLKINSANLVDVIIDAESKYNVEIDADSAEHMTNVGKCIDIISTKLAVK